MRWFHVLMKSKSNELLMNCNQIWSKFKYYLPHYANTRLLGGGGAAGANATTLAIVLSLI